MLPFSSGEILNCTDCECIVTFRFFTCANRLTLYERKIERNHAKGHQAKYEHESIVKILIIRHQKIMSFAKKIQVFFSNNAPIQFASNTMVIYHLGFLIVIVSTREVTRTKYFKNFRDIDQR